MTYKQAVFKQQIELFLISPIVRLGKIWGSLNKLSKQYTHFFFFPCADMGGSIKVNADIIKCVDSDKALIIFSKKPQNNKFLSLFQNSGADIIDLSSKIDNKAFHVVNIFYRGVLSSWMNSTHSPVILGGESLYFYKVIPFVKKPSTIIELCHLNTWFNYSQAFITKITYRIFSTKKVKRDVEEQYKKNNIPPQYFSKLLFIDNAINIPYYINTKNNILQIVFVGRGAPQKRVHIIVEILEMAHKLNLPVHFTFVGDVEKYFSSETLKICTVLGEINDEQNYNRYIPIVIALF
ncbi:MAG: hypothetical protein IPP48_11450 [Chitinophagaceae bacterium]|nr:hypothetical protein [Chitinophagaceae bacterium]